jgi:hypothetical protein
MSRTSTDPLGLRQHDPIEKWRAEIERQERERQVERRQERREERRAAMANETAARQQLEVRVAALEEQNRELQGQIAETARVTAVAVNALADARDDLQRHFEDTIAKMQTAITAIREKGEQEAKKTFEFARERIGEITDLPNFMPVRRVN